MSTDAGTKPPKREMLVTFEGAIYFLVALAVGCAWVIAEELAQIAGALERLK